MLGFFEAYITYTERNDEDHYINPTNTKEHEKNNWIQPIKNYIEKEYKLRHLNFCFLKKIKKNKDRQNIGCKNYKNLDN